MRVVTILIYIQSYSPIGCIRRFYKEKPPPERGNISCRRRGASGIARGDLQSNVFMRASCRRGCALSRSGAARTIPHAVAQIHDQSLSHVTSDLPHHPSSTRSRSFAPASVSGTSAVVPSLRSWRMMATWAPPSKSPGSKSPSAAVTLGSLICRSIFAPKRAPAEAGAKSFSRVIQVRC